MSSHYVYVIVNKINLKLYFGSHSWEGTGVDKNYYGSGTAIKRAVRKYGKDNFIVYPIKFYDSVEECRIAEEELLTRYDISNNQYCYNLKNAAVGWTSDDLKGRTLSEEYRKKLSESKKGEKHPLYGKRGKGTPMYGKHHTENTKRKMSQALKGKTHTEEHRNKLAIAHGGKPFVAIKDGKVKIFTSQAECSRVLGLHHSAVNACLKGRQKSAGGYTFKYLEQLESGIYEGML